MACIIALNNIPSPEAREAVNGAVREGIGARAGDWPQTPRNPAASPNAHGRRSDSADAVAPPGE